MTSILGISSYYHDSAAAIIVDGKVKVAAQEERFTRKKHDSSYPYNAVEFVLKYNKLKLHQVDYIVFYEKPFLKFERLLETYTAFAPKGFRSFSKSMPLWLREKLFQKKLIFEELKNHDNKFSDINKIYFSEHHLSHAASAFYPSPFEEAIILTADGVGEWATATVALGKKNNVEILKEIHFPHSLGLLYSAFTYYTGFKVNSGEYKLMGLAPYGEPKYKKIILDNLIDIKEDGSFRLNQKFFNYATGLTMTNKKFSDLFGKLPRNAKKEELTQFHMDIASSIQSVTEEVMIKITDSLHKEYNLPNLCLAGGVALNCVANGKILRKKKFKNIWIQPAAGDAGGSIGGPLALWYKELGNERYNSKKDEMLGSYLGPEFSDDEIRSELDSLGAIYNTYNSDEMINKTALYLSEEKTVGWFQGRMEFGPRALGNRSILADPRSSNMQKNLNLKIKFRESFRPFAPSILKEEVNNWFELDCESPYMLIVADVKKGIQNEMTIDEKKLFGIDKLNVKRSSIPAVTHVDYSARIQTVNENTNPIYYKLLSKFNEITKVPILVNTSFNVRGEPIVNTVYDAYNCFMSTGLDVLVCGNIVLEKKDQKKNLNNL